MGNEKTKEKKQNIVKEITEKIKNSKSIVFFEYKGLKDEEIYNLRKKLKNNNSEIKIYKNTLTKRALEKLNINLEECVIGPNAIAFSEDEVFGIKTLKEISKSNENLKIKGGIIDNEITDLETLNKLALIPSREGLLTMLAGSMISIPRDLSICLDLYMKEKK